MTEAQTEVPAGLPLAPISQLYEWSAWLHVGPEADACEAVGEEAGVNNCSNPLHVHAFCRLPNQFQHREIRKVALAAKARHVRLLRDPGSDEASILEDEMDRLARQGELAKPDLVDEIVGRDWWRDFIEAQTAVGTLELEDGTKPYEFVDEDRVRYQELLAAAEPDAEPDPELARLETHLGEYAGAVDAKQHEIAEPRRLALMERDVNALIDLVRDQRIEVDANEHFAHEYATMEWLLCTFRHPNGEPLFAARSALERADSAVIAELKRTYNDLEKSQQQGGGPGNS